MTPEEKALKKYPLDDCFMASGKMIDKNETKREAYLEGLKDWAMEIWHTPDEEPIDDAKVVCVWWNELWSSSRFSELDDPDDIKFWAYPNDLLPKDLKKQLTEDLNKRKQEKYNTKFGIGDKIKERGSNDFVTVVNIDEEYYTLSNGFSERIEVIERTYTKLEEKLILVEMKEPKEDMKEELKKEKTIPFNPIYKPEIEEGKYKVRTKKGLPVKIISWDGGTETAPIICTIHGIARNYTIDGKCSSDKTLNLEIVCKPDCEIQLLAILKGIQEGYYREDAANDFEDTIRTIKTLLGCVDIDS